MIYTPLTKKALKLCFEVHKNQTDKSGMPYVFHPFHLAEQMKDEYTVCTALLHDVVEDSHLTLEDLRNYGFPDEVVNAVALMTHEENVTYFDYVRKIKTNPVAAAVKLADLEHNMDLTRIDNPTAHDLERAEKYKTAALILKSG